MVAQFLLGCGGSPLFTLGTTYIDNHVKVGSSGVDSDLTLAFAPTSEGNFHIGIFNLDLLAYISNCIVWEMSEEMESSGMEIS